MGNSMDPAEIGLPDAAKYGLHFSDVKLCKLY
jgi:hypothetical protein